MSNGNQNQGAKAPTQQAPISAAPIVESPTDVLECRVIVGKFLVSHGDGEDGEDQYAQKGEVIKVTRKYYDKLCASRTFDTYQDASGTTTDFPHKHVDMPIELIKKSA